MTVNNSLTKQQPKFSVYIQQDGIKNLINNTLQDPERARSFTTAIISAVSTNPKLQECEAGTIIASALIGETLRLSPSPQLGHYYLVPYEDRKNNRKVATFQLGFKAYVQLAMRTGQYRDLDVIEIREGEYLGRDEETGKHRFKFMIDNVSRDELPVVGYLAYFELLNGFRKQMYWTKAEMEKHADTYSMAFDLKTYRDIQDGKIPKGDMWKYSSFWYKNFTQMAFKTMLRQLISKWGVMSIEMEKAYESDMAAIKEDGTKEYVDNLDLEVPQTEGLEQVSNSLL